MITGFEHYGFIDQTSYISNHAVAFVVRGLPCKWKQPLDYFLSSGPAKSTILQSMTKSASMWNTSSPSSSESVYAEEGLPVFNKMTLERNIINQIPCVYGWKLSINALSGLWQHLRKEDNFQFILTGRLNQDIEKSATTDIAMVIVSPPSLTKIYQHTHGYLLRKIPLNTCADCSNQLLLPQLPSSYQGLSVYGFL